MESHKVLRSLIHECFPEELRVKIDLLSRRRDIMNKEKQDELFKLFREYNIEGVVPLGSGTNRYAFRLNGYAVKIATDSDGAVDNLAEFKMSPKLQPYVTKTYEVSENGQILVAEYIQPFTSYTEMTAYQDQITNILNKLSLRYLIGDVGISSKNYSNWGLRISGDEPVCLDFAYIFDVGSEIFICQECKTNTMLIPTHDFNGLVCPNPKCGKRYSFEEVRMRISNEAHRKELGDLSDDGYMLEESNVDTVLDPAKSRYMEKIKPVKKQKKVVKEEEPVVLTNFIFNKEDTQMSQEQENEFIDKLMKDNPLVFHATVVDPNEDDEQVNDLGSGEIVFAQAIVNDESVGYGDSDEEPVVIQMPEYETEEEPEDDEEEDPVEESEEVERDPLINDFNPGFIHGLSKAISRLSNKIGDDLYQRNVFDEVKSFVKRKREFPETFYTAVQNAVFRSLVSFCGMEETELPNDKSPGTHRDWVLNGDISDESYKTIKFIEKYWNARNITRIENGVELMDKFSAQYGDDVKIDPTWKKAFIDRLMSKYPIQAAGAAKVADEIGKVWCAPDDDDEYGYDEEDDPTEDDTDEDPVDLAYTAPMEYVEPNDDPDDDNSPPLRVEIYPDDCIIHIVTCDQYGKIVIPIYSTLDAASDINAVWIGDPDKRNGNLEWLVHMIPDMMFSTDDPIKWMDKYNTPDSPLRAVIMDEDENTGKCVMGMYNFDGVFVYDDETDEMDEVHDTISLDLLNRLITSEIGTSSISYLRIATSNEDMIHDEADMIALENQAYENMEEDDIPTEAEQMAIDVLMEQNESDPNESVEESDDEIDDEDLEPLSPAEQAVIDALFKDSGNGDDAPQEEEHKVFTPIRRPDVEENQQ